jgi:hypothetical protein
MQKLFITVLVCFLLAGCSAKYEAWERAERQRAISWEKVETTKAQQVQYRKSKIVMEPIDPTKPTNARVVAEIFHSEGANTRTTTPQASPMPESTIKSIVNAGKDAIKTVSQVGLGVILAQETNETLREGFKAAGNKTSMNVTQGDLGAVGNDGSRSTISGPRDTTQNTSFLGEEQDTEITE